MNFSIFTFGCASNKADTNIMIELLSRAGWNLVDDWEKADVVIVNTCAVKGRTESKIRDFIRKLGKNKEHYRIIIAGCLPSEKKFIDDFFDYSMINPYQIDHIVVVVEEIMKEKKAVHLLEVKRIDKALMPQSPNEGIAIVQPLIGCTGFCSYCRTKIAKPSFFSFPLDEILEKIKGFYDQGAREVWISSEDNGAYGLDLGKNFVDLLYAIEDNFGEKMMFRFGMINPWHLYRHLDETIEFFSRTKAFFKFLHIPIQSASNRVLKLMKRPYSKELLHNLFSSIRNVFDYKKLTLATDVIVGFPSETEDEFKETIDFVKKYDFLVVNVSQFWPMRGTEAAKMKQLPTEVRKERSRFASKIFRQKTYSLLNTFVGMNLEIWFDKKQRAFLGRTRNYVSVISKEPQKLFSWTNCKIEAVENFHLIC